ncbi:MAG: sulfotransferase domain-containing protein [Chlorobi bacterium]|nr:sulfotransferase domain-containing protein [Chlorobiota bacterium]
MKINAIIIGAGRSGTTTLYQYLEKHPGICFSSIKEVHYFSVDELYERGEEYYHSFWKNCNENALKIAADTYLLISKKAPERIKKYNPEMKIIIILRNPEERAFSSYQYAINNGYTDKNISFTKAVNDEEYHIKNSDITTQNNLCHIYQSKYFEHISYWSEFFPRNQILILKTEDLKNNTEFLLKQLSDFLEISEFKITEKISANKSAKAKSEALQQFLLNRNTPARKFLRKILPKGIKNLILNSKFPEKLSSINRKEIKYEPLSGEDRIFAEHFLEKDKERMEKIFGIKL